MKRIVLIIYSHKLSLGVYIPFLVNFIRPYRDVEFRNINSNIDFNSKKYICIIPTDVPSMEFYNTLANSKFTCKYSNIFQILDSKNTCSKLVQKYKLIKHIPTLLDFSKNKLVKFLDNNNYDNFIIKHNNGTSSLGQIVVNKTKLKHIDIQKYTNCILQPYLTNYYIYSYDAVVKNGTIISELYSKITKKNGVSFTDFFSAINCKILDKQDYNYKQIKNFSKKLLQDVKYSGFIEIEFLVKGNTIYFLEINPRMCGHVSQLDNNYKSIYFNRIIIPYLSEYNIYIPRHKISSDNLSGTNPTISLIFFIKNYKFTIIIALIISFIAGYYYLIH